MYLEPTFLTVTKDRLQIVSQYNQQHQIFSNQCIRTLEVWDHQKELKQSMYSHDILSSTEIM